MKETKSTKPAGDREEAYRLAKLRAAAEYQKDQEVVLGGSHDDNDKQFPLQ